MSELPLAYRLPLQGTALIEASAGTGKTYTLVRLMARHILWHGYGIERVLAVTFTNAAATELKLRLRAFLEAVAAWCDGRAEDGDIAHLLHGRPPEVSEAQFLAHLHRALADMDRAAVFTIHGFCQRLLQRFALAMGQPIPAPTLLENESALRLQVGEEFWRRQAGDPVRAALLDREFKSPEGMAAMLPHLLSQAALQPEQAALLEPDGAAAIAALGACHAEHHAEARRRMLAAFDDEALHKSSFKSAAAIEALFKELADYLQAPAGREPPMFERLAFSAIKEKKNKAKPDNPLLRALDDWNRYAGAHAAYRADLGIGLYHALKAYAAERLRVLKRERGVVGFDDIIEAVHDALDGGDAELPAKIREAYPVALVDEFQDTDSRQWRIFECLYHRRGEGAALTLIGDPKQAIYGFRGGDIHTYLQVQALAERRESLRDNFRSNQALLDGIEALFLGRQPHPFLEAGIEFIPVRAGRAGECLYVDGSPPPAVALLRLPDGGDGKPLAITAARRQAAAQCADAIGGLLEQARSGRAVVMHTDGQRPLATGDLAVLVQTHSEAGLMQAALRERGIDSVCVRRDSIFAAYAALDLLAVLHYLQRPGAHRAEQTARNGLLLRSATQAGYRPEPATLAPRLQHQGPLAALAPVLAAAQPVLARQDGGERQLADYAQLLERLQAQFRPTAEAGHCLDWLGRQIELDAPADDGGGLQPYLESSQERVRIMTVHQSKGLEFGYVFLPFTAIRQNPKPGFARYFDGRRRCLYLKRSSADADIKQLIDTEQRAEALRLLYVGMTRAKFGLRCSWGPVKDFDRSALGHLLGDALPDRHPLLPAAAVPVRLAKAAPGPRPEPVPVPARLPPAWQISSFSGLHRAHEADYRHAADDEPAAAPADGGASPYKGAAFGNALHLVLEQARMVDWSPLSAAALAQCTQALLRFGYAPDAADAGAALLADLAHNTLHAALPEGVRLIDLPETDKRHEMEFHLRLRQAGGDRVLELLHGHGYCLQRTRFGLQKTLNGLLTGKIDLLYRHGDKLHVLDYKSNSLPDYGEAALAQSIRDQEYDLQYLLYTVAVHRWLRLRRPGYDYRRHFGGVRYLYARGLAGARPGSGVFRDLPEPALIDALDRCFSDGSEPDA